ncbi:innexin inx2-like [Artemia franciscana]|uniref:innexin inx2-like n=1 Tax=Artemia franciscana TaxID=6661 RepID=UPI0032DA78A5
MLPVLNDVKNVAPFWQKKDKKVTIDSGVARLHYKVTFTLLLMTCILASSWSFFGKAIQCMQDDFQVRQEALDQFCYVSSTFSLPTHFHQPKVGKSIPYIGIGTIDEEEPVYHNYYQWVSFILLLQACFFYAPHYLWKTFENGKVKSLIDGLTSQSLSSINPETEEKILHLVDYLYNTRSGHKFFGLKYIICESLYFVNIVLQIVVNEWFLGGGFVTLGFRALSFLNMDPEVRTDPLYIIFPRMTKCTFKRFGPSGTIQIHDSLCLLAINIINEKIYLFFSFWFFILLVITSVYYLYRLCILLSPRLRRLSVRELKMNFDYGDYLLLNFLKVNITDEYVFIRIMDELRKRIEGKTTEKEKLMNGEETANRFN